MRNYAAADVAGASPPGLWADAWRHLMQLFTRHRQLTIAMARREFSDRYQGQVLGLGWAFLHPVVLLTVYVFIFAYVFKIRVGDTAGTPLNYTIYLVSGLVPWLAFQESLAKSSTVIPGNANLVKQVIFPIEVLPVKGVVASLATQTIFLAGLAIYTLATFGYLPWTYAMLPVLMAVQALFMVGVAYLVSAISVYFRDMKDVVQVFGLTGVYLIPAFYLPELVPPLFRPVLYANPVSYLVWCYQDLLFYGRFEHWWAWLALPAISVAAFFVGHRTFSVLRTMFGNVL